MDIKDRISAFSLLGEVLDDFLAGNETNIYYGILKEASLRAKAVNPWFTDNFINLAMESVAANLKSDLLKDFVKGYEFPTESRKVAVITAGNLPLVGFQDFLSVLLSGHSFVGKLSSKDDVLLPAFIEILIKIEPGFTSFIRLEKELLRDFDAVIATGSNNSGRYFDYYFGKYPSIIRRNRNSVAVIHPEDNHEVYSKIGKDIFYYFGLGCRSVSKLMVPKGFDFVKFLDAMESYKYVADNFKYFNNYEYNKSIFLINSIPHYDTGFLLLQENDSLASPISVVHYEYYDDLDSVKRNLMLMNNQLQCVVSSKPVENAWVLPGETQFPKLNDWADGVDVLDFLQKLSG